MISGLFDFPVCCNKCIVEESESRMAACAYICEMTEGYENQAFIEVMKCFVGNGCLADYPRDGICVGENKDADQSGDYTLWEVVIRNLTYTAKETRLMINIWRPNPQ